MHFIQPNLICKNVIENFSFRPHLEAFQTKQIYTREVGVMLSQSLEKFLFFGLQIPDSPLIKNHFVVQISECFV